MRHLPAPRGEREVMISTLRHELETETPATLSWSEPVKSAILSWPEKLTASATHNTVTISWKRQPYAAVAVVTLLVTDQYGHFTRAVVETGEAGMATVTFEHLPPNTDFTAIVSYGSGGIDYRKDIAVSTLAPPADFDYTAIPQGPQNLSATATRTSVTVTLNEPYPGAEPKYRCYIVDQETGVTLTYGNATYDPDTATWSWTTRGMVQPVVPSHTYRVHVAHAAIPLSEVHIDVTTLGDTAIEATGRLQDPGPLEPWEQIWTERFRPTWPVNINQNYDFTDDVFTDRGVDFQKGLDIGEHSKYAAAGARVSGDPVYAVADGVMRVCSDDLKHKLLKSVMYCPVAVRQGQRIGSVGVLC